MGGVIKVSRVSTTAFVVISNLDKHNALTCEMWQSLNSEVTKLSSDESLRCVVIKGDGERAFAAGADISEFDKVRSTHAQVTRYHEEIVGPALQALLDSRHVVVASISGICTGGGLEIAAACDIRLATPQSRFAAAVARLGFPLAFAETELLVRKFGFPFSAELLLEGRIFNADEALQKGFIGRVVREDQLSNETVKIAENIALMSPLALHDMKRQLSRLLWDSTPITKRERENFYSFANSFDYKEGRESFLQKRQPKFIGK